MRGEPLSQRNGGNSGVRRPAETQRVAAAPAARSVDGGAAWKSPAAGRRRASDSAPQGARFWVGGVTPRPPPKARARGAVRMRPAGGADTLARALAWGTQVFMSACLGVQHKQRNGRSSRPI